MMRAAARSGGIGAQDVLRLRESTELLGDPVALRQRLAGDGYLLLRGVHPRGEVLDVRARLLEHLVRAGAVEPGGGAHLVPGASLPETADALTGEPALRALVHGQRRLQLFEDVLGEAPTSLSYVWLRPVPPGQFTSVHCDRVFMSRGSERLLTCWTPLGDVTLDEGPIALWFGSPYERRVLSSYGRSDVDRDLVDGYVSHDPAEAQASMGGRWYSADFRAGDVLVFGMDVLHGSLDNRTEDTVRLSCDTRYQPAAEPVDPRWAGETPSGHTRWGVLPGETLAAGRARWGLPPVTA